MAIYYGASSQRMIVDCIKRAAIGLSCDTSERAIPLMVGTCCAETGMGTYMDRYYNEGRGLFQFDSIRVKDIHRYCTGRKPNVNRVCTEEFGIDFNLYTVPELMAMLDLSPMLGAVMCRIGYMMKPKALPDAGDADGQAAYWKEYWNSSAGAGNAKHYLAQVEKHYTGAAYA